MTKNNNKYNSKKHFFNKSAWKYFGFFYKEHKTKLILTSIGSSAQVIFIIPIILLVKYAFDEVIQNKEINILIQIGILIFVLRFVNSIVSVLLKAVNIKIINNAIYKLRSNLAERLYSYSRSFYTQADQKVLHARLVQDTERLSNMSSALVSRLLPSLVISFSLGVVLAFLNWYLLLIIVCLVPLVYFSNIWMGKIIKKKVFVFQRAFEKFSTGLLFILRYIDLTNIQSAQKSEIEIHKNVLKDLEKKTNVMAIVYSINFQLQETLTGLLGIIIIIVGGIAVARDMMTLGEFLSFYMAAIFLSRYITNITSSLPDIITGNESLTTLYDLATETETLPYSGDKKIEFQGDLAIELVSFKYQKELLLKELSLNIKPGSKVAIIGPNGIGKTTIINLILGFYKPEKGQILAEGIPYDDLDLSNLRLSIGVVSQHTPLFSGTIKENILYGNPEIIDKDLIEACSIASVHEFIQNLPDDYETQIGEDGVQLSGGERQRIAIARALIRKPKLLILDEPTNHLDKEHVKQIMNNIDNLNYNPAILLISHDVGVVKHADEIFTFEDGKLILFDKTE
ncbi:MAG: ABC transporter ATP-binding protein/permease [Saprospiraceae bacterium]|nr:ABC transporter ATP-binding protein/permease [Saprospiraceae bacterium]